MTIDKEIRGYIKELFDRQSLGVLATCRDRSPYVNLVAFAFSDDLSEIFFTTGRATRKYSNLSQNDRVSFLVDSRDNRPSDFYRAAAVTALGRSEEVREEEEDALKKLYLERHPHLSDFVTSAGTAIFRLTVVRYILVRKFQQVDILDLQNEA